MPEVYEFLEAERIKYAIRLPANQVLQSRIDYLLTRPVGRDQDRREGGEPRPLCYLLDIGCEFLVREHGKFCIVLLKMQCEEVPME